MLKEIINNKRKEVESAKKAKPLSGFIDNLRRSESSFLDSIRANPDISGKKSSPRLIAEIKRRSPSSGLLKRDFNFEKTVEAYNRHASAISVLTDNKFFGGSLGDLSSTARLTSLPLLRKDFIIDEYQVYESRLHGADAILLIASILGKDEVKELMRTSETYGMACLVEVHNEKDLRKALSAGAMIIGVNNRNLETLEIDTGNTLRIIGKIPQGIVTVSESGIESGEFMREISGKVDAVLIGTYFLKSLDMEKAINSLFGAGKR